MNAKDIMDRLALAAYELAISDTHARNAAKHRKRSAEILAEAHQEFSKAMIQAQESRKKTPA